MVNYYELLRVPSTATTKEIKDAYRAMLLKHHPDKQSFPSTIDIDLLKTAFTVLSSPQHRAIHDASFSLTNRSVCSRPAESIPLETFLREGEIFKHPCRCGYNFLLELSDIAAEIHLIACPGCSETISVEYELVD